MCINYNLIWIINAPELLLEATKSEERTFNFILIA